VRAHTVQFRRTLDNGSTPVSSARIILVLRLRPFRFSQAAPVSSFVYVDRTQSFKPRILPRHTSDWTWLDHVPCTRSAQLNKEVLFAEPLESWISVIRTYSLLNTGPSQLGSGWPQLQPHRSCIRAIHKNLHDTVLPRFLSSVNYN
jgi:hypothetical protein